MQVSTLTEPILAAILAEQGREVNCMDSNNMKICRVSSSGNLSSGNRNSFCYSA